MFCRHGQDAPPGGFRNCFTIRCNMATSKSSPYDNSFTINRSGMVENAKRLARLRDIAGRQAPPITAPHPAPRA